MLKFILKRLSYIHEKSSYSKSVLSLRNSDNLELIETNVFTVDDKVFSLKVSIAINGIPHDFGIFELENSISISEFGEKYASTDSIMDFNLTDKILSL